MFGEELLADNFLITLFLGTVCLLCLYRYSTQRFNFWKKKGIPQAGPAIPFFGTILPMLWKPLYEVDLERYLKLGPIYGQYDGSNPVLAVADPQLLKEILVKDFPTFINRRVSKFITGDVLVRSQLVLMQGEEWKRMRSIVTPIFTTAKLKKMMDNMKTCGSTMIENLKKATENGKPFQVKQLTDAFNIDVLASVIYSIQLDSYKDPNNAFVQNTYNAFPPNNRFKMALNQLWPRLSRWLKMQIFNLEAMYFFKELSISIINQRKAKNEHRSDVLDFFMGLVKEFAEEKEGNVGNNGIDTKSDDGEKKSNNQTKKSLSLDEAIGQYLNIALGGLDTVSATISHAAYLLALNPDIQNRTFEEVRDVLHKTEGNLTYEALQEMNYLDNVISETLRLYPTFPRLERVAEADYKLGGTGVTIPKGTTVIVPVFALHRDPKLYPDPERFDPDRFLPEGLAKRNPYAYLPFGGGPRICIAMRFSQLQAKTGLVYLLANFKFHRCPKTKVPLEFRLGPGVLRGKNLFLRFEERTRKIPLKK